MILEILYYTSNREPVDVYIRNRHKDRDLHLLLAIEVLIIFHNLGNHHSTIARREYQVVVVNTHTAWVTEEGDDKDEGFASTQGIEMDPLILS